MEYKTVQGTDSFHVLIFQPGSETFLALNKLCACANCLDLRFAECESVRKYQPLVGRMNEKVTRSKTDMVEDIPELTISNMVTKNSIFAICAENACINYFQILCESEEQEHLDPLKPYVDECGNAIHYGTKYLLEKYLEIRNFNDKYHEFSTGKRTKTIAVIGETVFFPQVPTLFISKCNNYFRISKLQPGWVCLFLWFVTLDLSIFAAEVDFILRVFVLW